MKKIRDDRSWFFAFTHWNWKAALLTALFRGAACMAALRNVQPHARHHFSTVEMVYVLLTAGIFSAWQQQALTIKPRYFAWFAVVIIVPLTSLGADALAHSLLDNVNSHALGIGALIFTLVSAAFHWHIMQNGAMLVGDQAQPLLSDIKQIPSLLVSFVVALVRRLRRLSSTSPIEDRDFEVAA